MDIDEKKIDDFVQDRLPAEEMKHIAAMAEKDPELAMAIEDARIALLVANELVAEDIKTLTENWKKQEDFSQPNKKHSAKPSMNKTIVSVILLIFLIFSGIYYLINSGKKASGVKEAMPAENQILEEKDSPTLSNPDKDTSEQRSQTPLDLKPNGSENDHLESRNQRLIIATRLMPPFKKPSNLRSSSENEYSRDYNDMIRLFESDDLQGLKAFITTQSSGSELQITARELYARLLFQHGDYKKAAETLEGLLSMDAQATDDYEFMLLLCYYADPADKQVKFRELSNKIAADNNHTYHRQIKKLPYDD
jgi:hypothetical protein